jgi:DNA-binding MarR family transcriptional regulator
MTILNEEQKIFESIFNLIRTLRTKNSHEEKSTKLSLLQAHTLIFIKERQPIAMHDLAHCFQITKPTATSIINVLTKSKYVGRINDKIDRRVTKVKLTKKGEDFIAKEMHKKNSKVSKLLSYLTQEEKGNLMQILKKINNRLGEDYEKNN